MTDRTLGNTTASKAKDNVSDLVVWGDGDAFKLICKASSKSEGWMKSTKAMEIPGVGCLVQVTTLEDGRPAEALEMVRGVRIDEVLDPDTGAVVSRHLVPAYLDYPTWAAADQRALDEANRV